MKQLIIVSILLVFVTAQTYSTTDCTCAQLLSEGDCTKITSLNCAWDSTNKKCATSQTTTPTVETYAAYCDSFNQTDCPATNGCAWVSEKCTFFTGCTPFAKTTDADCQAISTKCITDGTHCVEKNSCNTYLKAIPCVKNAGGAFCYWDTTNNVCVDANTCDKLPVSLTTDADCRAQISTCTAKTGGGCQDSGINCSDQTTDISCYWNKAKNIACLWTGTACVDRTCANAPTSLTTDDACKSYRTDGSCTTKSGGGCVTRSTCAAATIQAACVTSSTGSTCYWNGTACVDKTCANAPNTMTTNTACAGFLPTCITTGTGCITNGACSVATIEAACVKNSSSNPCVWNVTCKDKTCANAPTSNNTHELCTTYLATCTVASGGSGCQTRTCANAPSSIVTNEACETYLPGSKCVAKSGGGCVTNGACSTLGQVACVKDASGNDCFWNGSGCVDKICTNAVATNTSHANCQSFMTKCTLNSTSAGCVDYTCENALTADICTTDFNGKPCIYKGKCYQKQCALAPSNTASHSDCQSYSTSCTLSNTGAGCVPVPLRCQAITLQAACVIRKSSSGTAACGWNGTQCIDRDCTTLDKAFTTTAQCSGALTGCVSANPSGGSVSGCIALPSTCAARQAQDNCEISGSVSCIWNSGTCVTKSCSTATIAGTTGVLLTVSQSNCAGYLTGCMVSNDGSSCIAKLTACSGYLSANNCIDGAKSTGGDCYWNSGTCVDKICTNITLNSHGGCYGILNTCTVNATKTSCMSLAACNTYTLQEQCVKNASNKACTWTGTACRDQICTDAPSTASYDAVGECEGFIVSSGTCAVIPRVVGTGGCMAKQASCTGYYESATCLTDSSNNTCLWYNGKCYLQSAFSCSDIGGITFNTPNCEGEQVDCKANAAGTACLPKACSDYSTQNGLTGGTAVSSDSHCSTLDSTCTIDNTSGAVKCQTKAAVCSAYITVGTCTFSTAGECYWNGTTCYLKSALTCTQIGGLSTWDTANCEGVLKSCKKDPAANACIAKVCADYVNQNGLTTGTAVSTDAHCKALDTTCTIDNTASAVKCQTRAALCSAYNASADICTVATEGTCYYSGSTCALQTCTANGLSSWATSDCEGLSYKCKSDGLGTPAACLTKTCADYTKTDGLSTGSTAVATDSDCSTLDASCTIDLTSASVKCQTRLATCSLYVASGTCTKATEGNCIWNTSGAGSCELISASNCGLKTGSGLTDTNCATHNAACIANRAGTACQARQSSCTAYTSLGNCTRTSTVECIGTGDASGTCTAVTATTACTSIFVGTGLYTHALCNQKNATCTNNSTTGCVAKTCSNATTQTSFSACNTWLSSCTWNGTSACVTISATCATQTTSACYQATEGDCHVIGTACVKKTCDNAPTSKNTDSLCSAFLSTCTIARTGGCIPRAACSTYTTSSQCGNKNTTGGRCYWSTTNLNCVDLTCANIDQVASNNNHSACNALLNTCTVRALSGAVANGCQSYGACSSYTIQEQCHTNASNGACEWNTNLDTPACVDKSCTTAPNTTNTHSACLGYFGTNACTVAAVAVSGAPNTLAGCIPVGPCSSYIDAEQCKINASNQPCGWNGSVCADFACTTSPSTNNTDALCQTYKSGCTVDQSGSGCMSLLATCEGYQIEGNCKFNLAGAPCYWNSTSNQCITRTCENAPDSTATDADCNTYLAGCTLDSVKCKTKICEDFQLATDALCKASLAKCTTDGTQCVLRGTCAQALSQAGCVTDSIGNQCEWIPASGTAQAYCTVKTCSTAPVDQYTTESQCSTYFTNCTTKNGGGCVVKTTCAAANVESACTVAFDGTKCQWDTTANNCRNKDCQDYAGSSHSACQAINSTCTAGTGGFCAKVKSCANTTVRAACIKGSDGPCLWITDAAGVGACYPYTSCKSLNWNTHNSCKAISPNCTTNGTNCLGITLCSETNVSGGCVKGYDGDCIQSVASLGSTDAPVCKAYTSCTDAFYATHAACQTASSKCTTNGTTGCIPLGTCQSYTQPGCYFNAAGPVLTNGVITSTGACTWDNTASACRDQNCSDLVGANHYTCAAQLSTCTSDGTACLTKSTCSTYLQPACGIAQGTDGTCIWQAVTATVTTAVCRVMVCSDVSSGTTTAACAAGLSGCVSNGTVCIAKANCSTYTTLTACNSGGLDGVCVFTASTATGAAAGTGTCALMTSCSLANNDQYACSQVKSRCSWTPSSGSGTTAVASKCTAHTCASYQATNSVCGNFLNWAQTLQQVCSLKNGVCTETDPTTLAQADCYSVSKYTYTWSASTSKCGVCTTPPASNNTTNQTNTTTNSTTTDSGYVLSFATIVLGYLMF